MRSTALTHGMVIVTAVSLSCAACSGQGDVDGYGVASSGADSASGTTGVGAASSSSGTEGGSAGNAASGADGTTGTGSGAGGTTSVEPVDCSTPRPNRAPIRRLTRFEYNSTVASLLGDTTFPANSLPAELLGNGFGNDADEQPVSNFLVEQYAGIAGDIAKRATQPDRIGSVVPCSVGAAPETEAACARTFIEAFAAKAYRRPVEPAEVDELLALERGIRAAAPFELSLASVIEAILQSPDFLYRPEFGVVDATYPDLLRPSGHEMASRLSYLFWGTVPDDELYAAAASGALATDAGVLAQATRMIEDPKARPVIRHFFDYYLPLNTLTDLSRDAASFPTFDATIGSLMREETQTFLEYEIFEGPGTWPGALTAPYTFVNQELANFYGMAGVVGEEFQRVDLDTTKRLGLLTQGGVQAGTTVSNFTNPVRRGVFLLRHIMCVDLPDPPESIANDIMPPDPGAAATGRERYSEHQANVVCAKCHAVMDPPGYALENFDAVGLWRDQENGVTIDATGALDILPQPFDGPVQLVTQIAASELTQHCFAENWLNFGYGRTLDSQDSCSVSAVREAFAQSGFNVKALLVALTQTDAFLYLSPEQSL
ncbi:MAG TPA: DUF1592 domain-containing protein [Polyangiaceae bacterium]